jgi:hypothetical protein
MEAVITSTGPGTASTPSGDFEKNDKQELRIVYQEDEKFEWREVIRGLTDVQAWLTGLGYLGLIVCLYSFSLFLPTIVAGLGYTGTTAQLHTGGWS